MNNFFLLSSFYPESYFQKNVKNSVIRLFYNFDKIPQGFLYYSRNRTHLSDTIDKAIPNTF